MNRKKFLWRDFLTLLTIILISAVCLLYKLGELPMLHGDEGASGVQATLFWKEGHEDLFRMGWSEQPMLSFALQGVFLRFFGHNVFGLRSASVFFALLSIIPFFLILRHFFSFSYWETLVTTCLYSFSHWFIAMARLGTNYIQIVPFELLAFLFLLWALQAKQNFGQKALFLISGFLSGAPIYLYHAGRLIPFLIIGSFVLSLPFKKKAIRQNLLHLIFLFLGIAISLLPFFTHYLQDSDDFFIRTKDVVIWGEFEDAFRNYGVESKPRVIWLQLVSTVKVFFAGGDNSEQYGYQGPIIPLIFQPFLLLGLLLAIANFRKKRILRCFLFCFFAILFFGGVLTVGPYPPFMPRLIGSMPFVFFLIGLGIKRIGELKMFNERYLPAFLLFLAIFWALLNLKVYFWDYASSLKAGWANYDPGTTIGYYLAGLRQDSEAVFFGCWRHYPTQGNIGFLAPGFLVHGEVDFSQAIEWPRRREKSFVFIFFPYRIGKLRDWWEGYRKDIEKTRPEKLNWEGEIQILKDTFPEGSLRRFSRSDGSIFFTAYEVRK